MDFDALLLWGPIYNRPFLRCLHGHALCLWRLGKLADAQQVFARILALNPPDNQGVRFLLEDVRLGRSWAKACGGAEGMAAVEQGDQRYLN